MLAKGVTGATTSNNAITAAATGAGAAIGVRVINAGANANITGNTITASNTAGAAAIAPQISAGGATATVNGNSRSGWGSANRAVDLIGAVTVSGSGNARAAGNRSSGGVIAGSIGFTNGTTCP